jgi:hypothetical protein
VKTILLERQPSKAKETEGFMSFSGTVLATIEQEWREDTSRPGGESNNSCVPSGLYKLIPHTRGKDSKHVVALVNEDLGVYYLEEHLPEEGGRFLILCHIANWSHDVVGCIAPGVGKADSDQGPMVTSSKSAMQKLMDYIDGDDATLEIRWIA